MIRKGSVKRPAAASPSWSSITSNLKKLEWPERKMKNVLLGIIRMGEENLDIINDENFECCGMAEVVVMKASPHTIQEAILGAACIPKRSLFVATLSSRENSEEDWETVRKLGFKKVDSFKSRRTGARIDVFHLKLETAEEMERFGRLDVEYAIPGLSEAETTFLRKNLPYRGSHYKCSYAEINCGRCEFLKAFGITHS